MTEYLKEGALVKALTGREKGQIFLIKYVEHSFAYLVNGKSRPLNSPKKKNLKHLYLLQKSLNFNFENCTDADVIKYIKDYNKSIVDCK